MVSSFAENSSSSFDLTLANLCLGLFAFPVLAEFAWCLHTYLFSPLKKVPGPRLAKFSRLWELFQVRKGNYERENIRLHEKYGPIVQVAPNRCSINDPTAVKIIYGHGASFPKSEFYHAFGPPFQPNLFSVTNNQHHSTQRRQIAHLYSMSTLLSYEQFVDECTALLQSKFSDIAQEGRSIQMVDFMQFYAFDVIGMMTFGERFGFLEAERDPLGVIAAISDSLSYANYIGLFPSLHDHVGRISALLGLQPPFKVLMDYQQNQLDDRAGRPPVDGKDFLSRLLRKQDEGKNSVFDIFNTCGNNIAAGSDTTAISLSSVIYHLIKYPHTLAALRKELDERIRSGEVSDPITFTEAQKLPYLQAVIKEALRIHPATGQILPRIVPPEGVTIAGTFLPGGTEVGINPWVAHRNKMFFGEDADEFRPERWLGAKTDGNLESYFLAFGWGSRTCIGKNISLLEMAKAIPQLVRHFDFELEDPASDWETWNAWFVKQNFRCRIKKRQVL